MKDFFLYKDHSFKILHHISSLRWFHFISGTLRHFLFWKVSPCPTTDFNNLLYIHLQQSFLRDFFFREGVPCQPCKSRKSRPAASPNALLSLKGCTEGTPAWFLIKNIKQATSYFSLFFTARDSRPLFTCLKNKIHQPQFYSSPCEIVIKFLQQTLISFCRICYF